MLALIERAAILVPLTSTVEASKPRFRQIAEVEWIVEPNGGRRDGGPRRPGPTATHPLVQRLKDEGHPGLVLFSSGTTGEPKGALHDFVPLLEKFLVRRKDLRTMAFLLFDHIGGVNTMLYTLSNGGTLVVVDDRSPDNVCRAIEAHGVELLPTSPTFLNLLLMSGAQERHDRQLAAADHLRHRGDARGDAAPGPRGASPTPRCSRPTGCPRSASCAPSPARTTRCG